MFSKPDYIILIAAFVSFLFSISLWFGVFGAENRDAGIFVGLWVPSILGFGLFFKMSALRKAGIMAIFIFVVGLLVSSAVCYALFAYTIHAMGTNEQKRDRQEN
jgi:glucan phosphoethanolaminetransferase (alkaline phosphatase superfamily)